jgi:hypothetical protein
MAGEAAGRGGPGAPCARPQAPVLLRRQRLEVFGGMGHSVAVPSGEYSPRQPVHDGGMVYRLATAEQGQ